MSLEHIYGTVDGGGEMELLAILLKGSLPPNPEGPPVQFVTPSDLSQQVGILCHPKGRTITAHYHREVPRQVRYTQEVLIVLAGKIRADFYETTGDFVTSRVLEPTDTLILVGGGHGFEVLEDCHIVEVKQGPYQVDDKVLLKSLKP